MKREIQEDWEWSRFVSISHGELLALTIEYKALEWCCARCSTYMGMTFAANNEGIARQYCEGWK